MAISVVQTSTITAFSNTTTFSAGVTLGNYLVVIGMGYASATPPTSPTTAKVGGTSPAGATQLLLTPSAGTTNTVGAVGWLLPVTAPIAGGTSVAVTMTAQTGYIGSIAYETTGWTGTPTLDQSSPGAGTGTAVSSGTTPAILYTPELIVGWLTGYAQGQVAPPTGFTNTDLSGGSGEAYAGWQIASTSGGTYSYHDTASGSANWCAGIVTLGVASAPSFIASPFRPRGQAVNRASTF